ncbi:hypothetical protein BN7_5463 [Wickerhamomyces ciferrii]|uniref:Zn(2)-C6 fungal-type domain-containing protein n=1 Tax=Wickerhamomyces ciferrii (strain ATCC 14091 / BCRC 22168 / CBS 111 / JCM 3599 / NBRC 0793 / NRRL Y-1031 F-60-10) TaxID=1206466 RepID=K0KRW3_WICCF|nr:uncharacterized protein BN7_5463 [Wickerhamomyces ciferrii]CCH45876.1 hypothetical protein BN7_5463 [Wickerhamomyces ciferrii]
MKTREMNQQFVSESFGAGAGEHDGAPKKRQRMSVVCLNCKTRKIKCDKKRPSCSNCEKCNVGHLCRYEAPHWVNNVMNAEAKSETILLPQVSPDSQQSNHKESTTDRDYVLKDEIKMLKDKLNGIEKSLFEVDIGLNKRKFDDDTLNFYTSYNSLNIKRSGLEDLKPLSSSSMTKKDPFLGLVHGYFFLCESLFGATNRRKVKSDEKRLDNSLISILELLGESESPLLKPIISKLVEDKFSTNASKGSLFPLSTFKSVFKPVDNNNLKNEIERILPSRSIIKLYIARFFKYVHPMYPIIDEKEFTERIFNTILQSSDDESRIKLNFEDKLDQVLTATLLIMLRLSHITINTTLSPSETVLKTHPISGHFIFIARTILSQFNVMRKSNLQIVQSLFLLRIYIHLSPEDGDGPGLNHSQVFSSLIVQSAFSIGLNRDIKTNVEINQTSSYVNIWTKMWHSVLDMDRIISALSGESCSIQNVDSYELRFPNPLENDSPIESSILNELANNHKFQILLIEIFQMVNNLNSTTKISDILSLLNKLEVFLAINYPLNSLTFITQGKEDEISYKNIKILQKNIIVKSLSLMIYQSIFLHFESDFNLVKHQHFTKLYIQTSVDLSNILSSYLNDSYKPYIDPNFNYYLNTIVENSISRVIFAFISLITRLYQAQKFFQILKRETTSPGLDKTLNNLIKTLLRSAIGLNTLLQFKLGHSYYQAFKSSITHKYHLRSLHKEGNKVINDTKAFLTIDSPERKNLEQRLLNKIIAEQGFSLKKLNDLDNLNGFLKYEYHSFETVFEYIENIEVLKRGNVCSERALWASSFDEFAIFGSINDYNDDNIVHSLRSTIEDDFQFEFNGDSSSLLTLEQLLNGDFFNSAIIEQKG